MFWAVGKFAFHSISSLPESRLMSHIKPSFWAEHYKILYDVIAQAWTWINLYEKQKRCALFQQSTMFKQLEQFEVLATIQWKVNGQKLLHSIIWFSLYLTEQVVNFWKGNHYYYRIFYKYTLENVVNLIEVFFLGNSKCHILYWYKYVLEQLQMSVLIWKWEEQIESPTVSFLSSSIDYSLTNLSARVCYLLEYLLNISTLQSIELKILSL